MRRQVILDWLIGIPVLVVLILVLLIVIPVVWLYGAFKRTICPNCKVPFGRRIVAETFDRENIKFNLDHYKVACRCLWCGKSWEYDQIRDTGFRSREDAGGNSHTYPDTIDPGESVVEQTRLP